jgi:hypothetical protein
MELNKAAQERDDLSSQLNQVLERRDQMEEMKLLLEAIRRATAGVATTPLQASTNAPHCNDLDVDDGDNMFEHCIHQSYKDSTNKKKKKK